MAAAQFSVEIMPAARATSLPRTKPSTVEIASPYSLAQVCMNGVDMGNESEPTPTPIVVHSSHEPGTARRIRANARASR